MVLYIFQRNPVEARRMVSFSPTSFGSSSRQNFGFFPIITKQWYCNFVTPKRKAQSQFERFRGIVAASAINHPALFRKMVHWRFCNPRMAYWQDLGVLSPARGSGEQGKQFACFAVCNFPSAIMPEDSRSGRFFCLSLLRRRSTDAAHFVFDHMFAEGLNFRHACWTQTIELNLSVVQSYSTPI